MFDRLASRYDLFNRLSSLGLDSLWRRKALGSVSKGMRVLDLGCGTGDLSIGAARRLKGSGQVTGLDFSEPMLEIARKRLKKLDPEAARLVRFVARPAEDLPLGEPLYDLVLSGFVLRNLHRNIDRVLSGVHSSLRKGGRISFLDFTEPPSSLVRSLWHFYMNRCVALYGKILFGKDYPDFYMTKSAERFLKVEEFSRKLEEKGFSKVSVKRFMFGIIVLYEAVKL